jgi:hypothetical protein
MRRFLLDTGIAGDYIHRRQGVYQRAREAVARGHRVGIGVPEDIRPESTAHLCTLGITASGLIEQKREEIVGTMTEEVPS